MAIARSTSACNAPVHEPMCPANGWLSHGSALASRVIVPAISMHSDAINGNQHALASRVIVPAISKHSDAINGNQEQSSTISGHQGHSDASREAIKSNQVQSSAISALHCRTGRLTHGDRQHATHSPRCDLNPLCLSPSLLGRGDPRRMSVSRGSLDRSLNQAIDETQSREGVLIRRLTRLSLERES